MNRKFGSGILPSVVHGLRAGLKGRGPGQFLLEGPYDVIHDVIVCKSFVFAD